LMCCSSIRTRALITAVPCASSLQVFLPLPRP
jgi:hypothetical protein